MRLKICNSHLTCKVPNKCLNVRERVEVVELNKRWSPPFPRCPLSRQCPWKKTLIQKKYIYPFLCFMKNLPITNLRKINFDFLSLNFWVWPFLFLLCVCVYVENNLSLDHSFRNSISKFVIFKCSLLQFI